ncbi:MAG: diacylglycerol kinase family protein [Eubacteriales bacterium]|nr:diacylglycerol kinase family protein [Eubacteriales bacterium]
MNKVISSFKYASRGISYVYKTQRNFRIQLMMLLLAAVIGLLLNISVNHWIMLIIISCLVLTLEIVNTAIENIIDMITDEYHESAEKAKDAAAGAVLVASFFSVVIGAFIFLSYIF